MQPIFTFAAAAPRQMKIFRLERRSGHCLGIWRSSSWYTPAYCKGEEDVVAFGMTTTLIWSFIGSSYALVRNSGSNSALDRILSFLLQKTSLVEMVFRHLLDKRKTRCSHQPRSSLGICFTCTATTHLLAMLSTRVLILPVCYLATRGTCQTCRKSSSHCGWSCYAMQPAKAQMLPMPGSSAKAATSTSLCLTSSCLHLNGL